MQSILQRRRLRRDADETARKRRAALRHDDKLTLSQGTHTPSDSLSGMSGPPETPSSSSLYVGKTANTGEPNDTGEHGEHEDEHDKKFLDPHLWSYSKRLWATAIIFFLVFVLGWNSTCDSNINSRDSKGLGVSKEAESLPTALFMIGISLGSLAAGPISETVGRNPAYLVSTSTCICFTLGAALAPNFGAQLSFRFLAGLASSPTLSMYGGSLADLFTPEERATIWPVFALSPLLGPVFAPLAGGWISGHISWRWVYWIALLLSVAGLLVTFLFLPETYEPVLESWHESDIEVSPKDSKEMPSDQEEESLSAQLWDNLSRPAKFFTTEPIIIFLGIYLIVIYVVNFSFLSGFSFIFGETYGLSEGITSLAFVSIIVGALINTLCTPVYRAIHKRLLHRHQQRSASTRSESDEQSEQDMKEPPELRLIPAVISAPLLAISLFWLGWTNYPSISPLSGYFATGLFGFAITGIFVSSYQYIIDSYETYSGSALASITMARYSTSAGMLIATRPMYNGIGVRWALTLLGILAVLLVPVPYWLLAAGKSVRHRSSFACKDR